MRSRFKYVQLVRASGKNVAERWKSQYRDEDGRWGSIVSGSSKDIYERLIALGADPDIDQVAEIIGNKGWSYVTCSVCSDDVRVAVEIGEYESRSICPKCIAEASELLSKACRS